MLAADDIISTLPSWLFEAGLLMSLFEPEFMTEVSCIPADLERNCDVFIL